VAYTHKRFNTKLPVATTVILVSVNNLVEVLGIFLVIRGLFQNIWCQESQHFPRIPHFENKFWDCSCKRLYYINCYSYSHTVFLWFLFRWPVSL